MFAYVQSRDIDEWYSKVNGWLINQFNSNTDSSIVWLENEQLSKYTSLSSVEKYSFSHTIKYFSHCQPLKIFKNVFRYKDHFKLFDKARIIQDAKTIIRSKKSQGAIMKIL